MQLQAAFWRSHILDVLAAFVIILTFAAPVVSGFRPSHAGLILFSGTALISLWDRPLGRAPMVALFLYLSVIVTSTASAFLNGPGNHLGEEQVRNFLMFGGTFMAGYSMSADRLRKVLNITPYLCAATIFAIFIFFPNPFSYGARLSYGEYLFAPGLSYAITLCLAVALAAEKKRWHDHLLIIFLLLSEALTFTRAEIISIVILLWIRIGFRNGLILAAGTIIPIAIFVAPSPDIQRLFVIRDALETGGSGRLQVWSYMVNTLLNTPGALLLGFGPGSVHYIANATQTVDKAHNIPLDTLYAYGVYGFTIMVATLAILCRKIDWRGRSNHHLLVRNIFIVAFVNGLVNGSFFDGALNGLSAIFFGYVVATIRESPSTAVRSAQKPINA
jgi:hypothetical protein